MGLLYLYMIATGIGHIAFNTISARQKYQKTACTSPPEDEHLAVRNMSKTL
jgi:hypothetical protein